MKLFKILAIRALSDINRSASPRVLNPIKHSCSYIKQYLKHKYKYPLSTNLPCVSRHSQFLTLLCIFPELISHQESCRSRSFRLSSRLFGCLKCLLLLIVRHIFEIINDHPSLVVKVAKIFLQKYKIL